MSNPKAEQMLELANKLITDEGWAWTWAPTSEGVPTSPQFLLPPEGDARRNWCAMWSRIPDTLFHMPHWAVLKEKPQNPITLTGADERTNVADLAKLEAEIGLLYTDTPEGRNRYPRWGWIQEVVLELRRASLHVCGSGARASLAAGELPVSGFQRIQVNGGITTSEVETLCAKYPNHTIITQHHANNAHLLSVKSPNHALLIDASGGRGVSPDGWGAPETQKVVGFAGGLGPDNLASELGRIREVARSGWWVDMEGKLRVDDWFSLDLAKQCIQALQSNTP